MVELSAKQRATLVALGETLLPSGVGGGPGAADVNLCGRR